jgi:hypothetical protein
MSSQPLKLGFPRAENTKERQKNMADNTKKSLTVEALAVEIKKARAANKGATSKTLQQAIRDKGYTFAKDKWPKAIALADKKRAAPAKPPMACLKSDVKSEFLQKVDGVLDNSFQQAAIFFRYIAELCLRNPKTVVSLDSKLGKKTAFCRALDLACEAGLLEKVVGYRLSDTTRERYRQSKALKTR